MSTILTTLVGTLSRHGIFPIPLSRCDARALFDIGPSRRQTIGKMVQSFRQARKGKKRFNRRVGWPYSKKFHDFAQLRSDMTSVSPVKLSQNMLWYRCAKGPRPTC